MGEVCNRIKKVAKFRFKLELNTLAFFVLLFFLNRYHPRQVSTATSTQGVIGCGGMRTKRRAIRRTVDID